MDRYILLHNTARLDYTGDEQVEIAKIVDSKSGEAILYIDYSKDLYKTRGYHTCIEVYGDDIKEYPVAIVDDYHRDNLLERPDIFLCMMLHEYGHYINGDLNATGFTDEIIQNERMRYILQGRVMEMELKADAVAIKYVGKDTFIRAMNYMAKKRRERGGADIELAIREFELRKKAARKL